MPIALPRPRTRVILESPYGSPDPAIVALNVEYLQKAIRHSTLVAASFFSGRSALYRWESTTTHADRV